MNFTMKLHYRLQESAQPDSKTLPVLLVHGLFGTLDNLGVLARDLKQQHSVLQVDMRNHGQSGRSDDMSYAAMAQDLLETLDDVGIQKAIVIGHSMGGKAAMAMTALAPERIAKLVVIDVAPVDYQTRRHDEIFAAINAVTEAGLHDRSAAAACMRDVIKEEGVIQFLLKSFQQGEWRFNVPVLMAEYEKIVGWETLPAWPHPALFIRGGLSPYVQDKYRDAIASQFPLARAHVVAGTGHWVHAEKPEAVLRAVHRFIDEA
ncbi:esterase [Ewingella americana]|uniref:Esterase n=1 Tax=Ewingella americana TaxID=41202 RepID=A0A502GR20_9GAMM|nr:esterase [Ewingella americana]TPG63972.1 esterase [Ewingella americana]